MYAISCAVIGNGFANRYERKLGVSLFALANFRAGVVNLLYDQQ